MIVEKQGAPGARPFRLIERVRWSDVDAAGIVCYGSYLRFLEAAETELFRSCGLTTAVLRDRYGIWLVRRRIECDFHRSIRLDAEVEISAWISRVGRTSLELRFRITGVGEQAAAVEARYVLVAVDRDSFRPVPLAKPLLRHIRSDPAFPASPSDACARP